MDEFSFQEANRFQGEQVVNQERVGVFESTDDTSKDKRHRWMYGCMYEGCMLYCGLMTNVKEGLQVYLWASTRACEALSSV